MLLPILAYLATHATALPTGPAHGRLELRTSTDCAASTSTAYVAPSLTLPAVTPNGAVSSASYSRLTALLPTILQNAVAISAESWELGVLTETLLEVYSAGLTPFAWDGSFGSGAAPDAVLEITAAALAGYDWSGSPGPGGDPLVSYLASDPGAPAVARPLVDGAGALGDPCSLGTAAWVLANYVDAHGVCGADATGADYAWAVGNQHAYLVQGTASSNGTISQREGYFETWSDMGYMIPPFPAYLGLTTGQSWYLSEAISQWLLESSGMLDTTVDLYRHVNDWDARLWATGNGWMLTGGLRVIASIIAAGQAGAFASQIEQVETTMEAVFAALFKQLDSDSLVPDYMNQDDPTLALGDSAGTAAIVSAFYRFYALRPDLAWTYTASAAAAFDGVMAYVGDDGWLTHASVTCYTYSAYRRSSEDALCVRGRVNTQPWETVVTCLLCLTSAARSHPPAPRPAHPIQPVCTSIHLSYTAPHTPWPAPDSSHTSSQARSASAPASTSGTRRCSRSRARRRPRARPRRAARSRCATGRAAWRRSRTRRSATAAPRRPRAPTSPSPARRPRAARATLPTAACRRATTLTCTTARRAAASASPRCASARRRARACRASRAATARPSRSRRSRTKARARASRSRRTAAGGSVAGRARARAARRQTE